MYVSDVEDTFPILPLAPIIWWFMLFRWFDVFGDGTDVCDDTTYMHLFADFGTRGAPGSFKVF